MAGGGSNVDSDVVDSNSGVSHKDDPSDWGKRGDLTWEFMHSKLNYLFLVSLIPIVIC